VIVLLLALPACAAAPPRSVPAAPSTEASEAPAAHAAPPAEAPADATPTATVTAVAPAKGDAKGLRARMLFSNPSKRTCRVLGYKATWGTRSKTVTLQDLTLPPGETRDRWLKVAPDDGDLDALTVEGTRVELDVACS
jgi:hypothetical protein